MSQQDRLFRKSSFGGFNKQDVAAYLQSMAREHREETEALRGAADKLRAECNTYKSQLDERQRAQEEFAMRNMSLSEALAAKEQEAGALRREAAEAGAELERLRSEIMRYENEINGLKDEARTMSDRVTLAEERLGQAEDRTRAMEQRVAELATEEAELFRTRANLADEHAQVLSLSETVGVQNTKLKEYEEKLREVETEVGSITDFKARISEVERAAYRRAEAIENEARRNAEIAGEALQKDATEMKNRLTLLRREAFAAAAAAVAELEKARTQLEYVDAVFGGLDERLDGVLGCTGPVIRDFVPEEFN